MAAAYFTELVSTEFYIFGSTSCKVKVLYNTTYNKYYVGIYKKTDFDKDGEKKSSENYVALTIPAAESLLTKLAQVIKDAKFFKGV